MCPYVLAALVACGQGGGASEANNQDSSSSQDDTGGASEGGVNQKLNDPETTASADTSPKDQIEFTNSIGMVLRRIEPGTFVMGGSGGPAHEIVYLPDEGRGHSIIGEIGDDATNFNTPAHEVEIKSAFYIGTTEVTQAQYEAVMNDNDSLVRGDDLPVFMIDWHEAKAFCDKLSEMEGRTYRLPTEAEWEYACRAGTTTRFFWGDDPDVAVQYARFTPGEYTSKALAGDEGYGPDPVASYKPNPWGLYDMYGNVLEWCEDWADYYPGSTHERDIPAEKYRINRGSAWSQNVAMLGSALRSYTQPDVGGNAFGFRVVLEIKEFARD